VTSVVLLSPAAAETLSVRLDGTLLGRYGWTAVGMALPLAGLLAAGAWLFHRQVRH
jgi:hypothetical protein